jgi:hypothetical protein
MYFYCTLGILECPYSSVLRFAKEIYQIWHFPDLRPYFKGSFAATTTTVSEFCTKVCLVDTKVKHKLISSCNYDVVKGNAVRSEFSVLIVPPTTYSWQCKQSFRMESWLAGRLIISNGCTCSQGFGKPSKD